MRLCCGGVDLACDEVGILYAGISISSFALMKKVLLYKLSNS